MNTTQERTDIFIPAKHQLSSPRGPRLDMLLQFSWQIILPLSNASFDMYKHEVILYHSDSCKSCAKVRDAYEQAAESSEANFYRIDCDKWPHQCKNVSLPSISAGYRGTTYFMVEKMDSAQEIENFVKTIKKTITTQYTTLSLLQESFENQGFTSYLVFSGPEQDFFEDLLLVFKGKLVSGYLYGTQNKIIAYRDGFEVIYNGDFSQESVLRFVGLNRHKIFQRLSPQVLHDLEGFRICFLIFNPANASHKAFARQMREMVVKIVQKQALVGRECAFAHTNTQNKELSTMIQTLYGSRERPAIAVIYGNRYRVYDGRLGGLEEFLEGVIQGELALHLFGGQDSQPLEDEL